MKLLYKIILTIFIPLMLMAGFTIFQIEILLKRLDQSIHNQLRETGSFVKSDFDETLIKTRQIASLLSKSDGIVHAVMLNDVDLLFQRAQAFLNIGISYMAFLNDQAMVVSRGHDEFHFGDKMAGHPCVRSALDGRDTTMVTIFDGELQLISFVPIRLYEEQIVGLIAIGVKIDQRFLRYIGKRRNVHISIREAQAKATASYQGNPDPSWDSFSFVYRVPKDLAPDTSTRGLYCNLFKDNEKERSSIVTLRKNILYYTTIFGILLIFIIGVVVRILVNPIKLLVRSMYDYAAGKTSGSNLPTPNE